MRVLSVLSAAFCIIVLLNTTPAASQSPSSPQREQARQLMRKGRRLVEQKDPQGALRAYQAADEIMHVPTTGLAVAQTLASLGRLVQAKQVALAVTQIPPTLGEHRLFVQARHQAAALAQQLEARIPTVRIIISGTPSSQLQVLLDGVELPREALEKSQALDPGPHKVQVRPGNGRLEVSRSLQLQEGQDQEVRLTLQDAPGPSPRKPGPPLDASLSSTIRPHPSPSGAFPWWGYTGFGVGSAALVVGSVTGLMSASQTSELKSSCGTSCPVSEQSKINSAKTLATVSNVSFATAALGLGVGLYGLLSSSGSGEKPSAPPNTMRWEPWVGATGLGVQGSF